MKNPGLKLFRSQRGFTLIELMVAVAITGIISLGAAVSSGQVLNQTSRDRDYTLASRNAENAIYWITLDALMAQKIQGSQTFPASGSLSLSWSGWDNVIYSANYTVTGGVLTRTYAGGSSSITTMIAQHINVSANMTGCVSTNGTLTLSVTASVGQGAKIIDVKKTRVITSRPGL
jgi:prepilin-type N-terminal cleavage/methylation domain-containing protein